MREGESMKETSTKKNPRKNGGITKMRLQNYANYAL